MKLVMISQAMRSKTKEEIEAARKAAIHWILNNGFEFVSTYEPEAFERAQQREGVNAPLWYLGFSLQKMASCDAVLFLNDTWNTRGCLMEEQTARYYDVPRWYWQDDGTVKDQFGRPVQGDTDE